MSPLVQRLRGRPVEHRNVPIDTAQLDDLRLCGLQLPDEAVAAASATAGLLSVSQSTTYRWSLEEDLAGRRRAGIRGIGLYRAKIAEYDDEDAADMIVCSGVHVSSLSWVGGFTGSDGSRQMEALFDACEAVRFAAMVSADTVCVVSGGPGQHIVKHARRLLVDALQELADEAGSRDVSLALHPISAYATGGQSFISTLDQAADLITQVDRPNVGLVFDLFQVGRDARAVQRIPELLPLVHLVKLADRRGRGDVRRHLGDGGLPIATVVQEFVRCGYSGAFEIDLWSDAAAGADQYDDLLHGCRERFESLASEAAPA